MDNPELIEYIFNLKENERLYATRLKSALLDEIGSEWPEITDFGLTFHRGLEILGVLNHYFEHYLTDERLASQSTKN